MTGAGWPDDWRLFIVTGVQRTGTTLLREILNSSRHIVMVAEVMIPYPDSCHWNHFMAAVPEASDAPADEEAGIALLDMYFHYLHREVRRKWNGPRKKNAVAIGVDIKLDQLRLIQPRGWPASTTPFILHYALKRKALLINTVRHNVIQCSVSFLIGLQRNFWHNYDGRQIDRAYEIDIIECLALARSIASQQREFEFFTKDYPVQRCAYEDLAEMTSCTGDLAVCPGPLEGIASALNVPCDFSFTGQLQRAISRPYKEIISNYHALIEAVRSSEFRVFANTIN